MCEPRHNLAISLVPPLRAPTEAYPLTGHQEEAESWCWRRYLYGGYNDDERETRTN